MNTSFRFYAQLNAFLDPDRRGVRFVYRLAGPASVKDTIEAIGVPHPEVDVILVNGSPVTFDHRMREGDSVSVYPRFRRIDVTPLEARAGSGVPHLARFVLDVHLGKLASLLRLSGFDALLLEDDQAIAECAAREQRIVLTRDVALLKRGSVRYGRWIRSTDPERQLVDVIEHFELAVHMQPFSRCLECNAVLMPADADTIATKVDPDIRSRFRDFRQCPGCGRVYWQGTHYRRLLQVLERARLALPAAPRAGD